MAEPEKARLSEYNLNILVESLLLKVILAVKAEEMKSYQPVTEV